MDAASFSASLARAIAETPLHNVALDLLRTVPGFPPLVQTVHLLGIAAIMGSAVVVDLKILGVALPSQETREVIRRLMPWTWWALPFIAVSGLVFVFAQPHRYFDNPVFRVTFTLLPFAIASALAVHRVELGHRRVLAKLLAVSSLALWIGVVMAGRWIAYAEYLMPVE